MNIKIFLFLSALIVCCCGQTTSNTPTTQAPTDTSTTQTPTTQAPTETPTTQTPTTQTPTTETPTTQVPTTETPTTQRPTTETPTTHMPTTKSPFDLSSVTTNGWLVDNGNYVFPDGSPNSLISSQSSATSSVIDVTAEKLIYNISFSQPPLQRRRNIESGDYFCFNLCLYQGNVVLETQIFCVSSFPVFFQGTFVIPSNAPYYFKINFYDVIAPFYWTFSVADGTVVVCIQDKSKRSLPDKRSRDIEEKLNSELKSLPQQAEEIRREKQELISIQQQLKSGFRETKSEARRKMEEEIQLAHRKYTVQRAHLEQVLSSFTEKEKIHEIPQKPKTPSKELEFIPQSLPQKVPQNGNQIPSPEKQEKTTKQQREHPSLNSPINVVAVTTVSIFVVAVLSVASISAYFLFSSKHNHN